MRNHFAKSLRKIDDIHFKLQNFEMRTKVGKNSKTKKYGKRTHADNIKLGVMQFQIPRTKSSSRKNISNKKMEDVPIHQQETTAWSENL